MLTSMMSNMRFRRMSNRLSRGLSTRWSSAMSHLLKLRDFDSQRTTGRSPLTGRRSLWRDDHATATIEFTMVFPILLFLMMLLTQSSLLMGARLVVNHAAFAATRSAVVVIPTNHIDRLEPYNTVQGYADSYKTKRIRQVATLALLPVAGKMEESFGDTINPQPLVDGLTRYYQAYNREAPFWIERYMPDRLRYAAANTSVTILRTRVQNETLELEPIVGEHTFGPRDPITVRVTHRMNLAVPYVGMLFADGRHAASEGGTLYTNITSQCTLTNEGVVNALPPTPELDRIP